MTHTEYLPESHAARANQSTNPETSGKDLPAPTETPYYPLRHKHIENVLRTERL